MAKKECCAIISVLCSAEPVSVGHRSRSGRESMRHCRRNAFLSPDRHSSLQSDVAISDVNAEEFDFWYRHRRDVACCKSRCQLVGYWTNERIAGRPQCVPITIDWLYEESSDTWLGVRTKCHSRNERPDKMPLANRLVIMIYCWCLRLFVNWCTYVTKCFNLFIDITSLYLLNTFVNIIITFLFSIYLRVLYGICLSVLQRKHHKCDMHI